MFIEHGLQRPLVRKRYLIALVAVLFVLAQLSFYPRATFAATTYEAEAAALAGGAKTNTDHAGYTGSGFVDGYWNQGASTQFSVSAASAGSYTAAIRYANSMGGARTLSLYVNGAKIRQITLANQPNWDTWATETETVSLVAGNNTIAYKYDAGDSGNANLDSLSVAAVSTGTIVSGSAYKLINPNSGKALDAASAGTADGTNVQIWTDNGTAAQQWRVNANGDGTYTLINVNSGKALDVASAGTADGTNVQLWTSNGTAAQKWRINSNGDGTYLLLNVNSGKALDVQGSGTADGTNVQIWGNTSTVARQWRLVQVTTSTPTPPPSGGFIVSEAQFNQMFPSRNPFYTYSGLLAAMSAYPGFTKTGSTTIQKQEAAAFLANVYHETGGLYYIVEQNTANYPHYCDTGNTQYPCASGKQYYGRGPLQLSWNYNYGAAGAALGLPLLSNPDLVAQDASVAWKTALWFWNTQTGAGRMTAHNAMVNSAGFGETIRTINGSLECGNGYNAQAQSRIDRYTQFTSLLGVDPGGNLGCQIN